MDFSWTSEQEQLYASVLAFARARLNDDVQRRDADGVFSRDGWRRCAEMGLLGLPVPDAYGGMGLDAQTTARAIEAFGRGCEDGGLVFSVCAHLFACVMPIAEHGDEALRRELLPRLCRGDAIGANAITEPASGSDAFALTARARADGDGYILEGEKVFVTNGPVADVFLVYASTNPSHGFMGLSAFLLDRGTPGLSCGQPFDKVGLRTSPLCSVRLEGCRVPVGRRLGVEGQGAAIFKSSMSWERACLFAAWVGSMERQLERCIAYASTRQQFGRPIGKKQAIAHRIADMKLRLEGARLLLYRACWAKDRGGETDLDIALSKIAVSEACIRSGLDTVQIHGGLGVMAEANLERGLRDAIPGTIYSGTSEVLRDVVARSLGL